MDPVLRREWNHADACPIGACGDCNGGTCVECSVPDCNFLLARDPCTDTHSDSDPNCATFDPDAYPFTYGNNDRPV